MSTVVEIFKSGETTRFAELPVGQVLRSVLSAMLRRDLTGARITFYLNQAPGKPRLFGKPSMYNLLPDYGYGTVMITQGDAVLYRHPHTVEELIAEPLREVLKADYADVDEWTYRLVGPGIPRAAVRQAPLIEGAFETEQLTEGDTLGLEISRAPEPEPEKASLDDFGLPRPTQDNPSGMTVIIDPSAETALAQTLEFSNDVEEGGFLTGVVYRDADREDGYIVHVKHVPKAEHSGASFFLFNFTGDSFRDVKMSLARAQSGDRLVGWFHTHLFPATDDFGLSTIDVDLHVSTFTQPWQVAALVNIDRNQRTLRCYARSAETLVQCPMLVAQAQPGAAL